MVQAAPCSLVPFFSSASLLSDLKQLSEKCANKPAVWLRSRHLLVLCNVPSGSGNQTCKVTKHNVKGDPKGSFLQFVVLVATFIGISTESLTLVWCYQCVTVCSGLCHPAVFVASSFLFICSVLTFIFFLKKIKGIEQFLPTIFLYFFFLSYSISSKWRGWNDERVSLV